MQENLTNDTRPNCWCQQCRNAYANALSGIDALLFHGRQMVVCPDCGNKRCPKANFHGNACTGSNAVGQPGSSWENVKPFRAESEQRPAPPAAPVAGGAVELPPRRDAPHCFNAEQRLAFVDAWLALSLQQQRTAAGPLNVDSAQLQTVLAGMELWVFEQRTRAESAESELHQLRQALGERAGWVRVAERLPERIEGLDYSTSVLVYAADVPYGITKAFYDYRSGLWEHSLSPTALHVSHWQPLPDVPHD